MKKIPYQAILNKNEEIELIKKYQIKFVNSNLTKQYNYVKSGIKIGINSFNKEKPLTGNEEEIIEKIHQERFNPKNPYVITGGHFHQLYVRNLGIFYNCILDPRIPSSNTDWLHRQMITLQTLAVDLEVFSQAGKPFTTIVPLKGQKYTAINVYTYPSDSLFAMLYTLLALQDASFITDIYPAEKKPEHKLQTQKAAKKLGEIYKQNLLNLLNKYTEHTIDKKTNLIKQNIHLASARDGIKRQSSFYDNVILWATWKLAEKLEIVKIKGDKLQEWKMKIIQTFWDEKKGIFIDDLSKESRQEKIFSADSFIVTSTKFLNINDKKEKNMLARMIEFVKNNNLDKPFPLHYSNNHSPQKLYFPVKFFAPSYMTTSIWSHWGMEYIKALLLVGKDDKALIDEAKKQLEKYKQNIEESGGYPELYDTNGRILKQKLYKSVLHNSWVINYEQAKMIANSSSKLLV